MRPLVGFPATGCLLLVAVAAALRWHDLLPWAVALCLATYAAALLAAGDPLDPLAPAFAAGVLLGAELAYWSLEGAAAPEPWVTLLRRLGVVAALALATAALGSVLLAAALVRPPGGPLVLGAGVAAAVAAFVLLARFAHAAER